MPHHNQSARERVIALVEEGNLPLQKLADGMAFLIELRGGGSSEWYWETGETSRRAGMGFWCVSSQAEDAQLVDEAQENPFLNSVQLRCNTAFPGCPRTVRNRMTEAGLTSRSAAVKEKLSEEHRLCRLEVELLDWPPCGADLNPIENVSAETKRVMAENLPDPSPASKNALWDVVLDAWEEVSHSEGSAATLVESLLRRMQMEPYQGLHKHSKLLDRNVEKKQCIPPESNQRPYGSEPSVLPAELVVFYMQ
jgi:hypothetical protein